MLFVLLLIKTDSNNHQPENLKFHFKNTNQVQYKRLIATQLASHHQIYSPLESLPFNNFWDLYLAQLGSPKYQYRIAQYSKLDKILWLEKAAEQLHQKALFELVELNVKQRNMVTDWLATSTIHYPENLYQQSVNWRRQGNNELADLVLESLAESGFNPAKEYQRVAQTYFSHDRVKTFANNGTNCSIKLGILATSIETAKRAERLQQQFETKISTLSLPICIHSISGFDSQEYSCELTESERYNCDYIPLTQSFIKAGISHLIVLAEEGKAYVKRNLMYLDDEDSLDVLIHELAHFVGFVDEYELSYTLAGQFCNGKERYFPNLLVLPKGQHPQHTDIANHFIWRPLKITPSSLYKVKTCTHSEYQAWRPVEQMTFLQYQEMSIPEQYLSIWRYLLN